MRYRRNVTSYKGLSTPKRFKPISLPNSVLLVGELEELECQTPLEDKVDAMQILKSSGCKGSPLVCASGDGKFGIIVASKEVLGSKIDSLSKDFKKAVDLHAEFHGAEHNAVKKAKIGPVDYLVFFGWLNYIVYAVPDYSERRGTPFIHEAKDKGDDTPPAKEKPIVCVSPNKDMIVIYGKEFEFTDRGFIG